MVPPNIIKQLLIKKLFNIGGGGGGGGGQDPAKGTAHGALKCCRGTAQRALHGLGRLPEAPWVVRGDHLKYDSPNHQCISNQSVPAFVQSFSQSQARLMFVSTLGMDNFDCTKMIKKIYSLSAGGAHSSITSPNSPPYVAKQLMVLFYTQPRFSLLAYSSACSTNDILSILVKAQPSTQSTGPRSPTRLGIQSQELGLPDSGSKVAMCHLF